MTYRAYEVIGTSEKRALENPFDEPLKGLSHSQIHDNNEFKMMVGNLQSYN